MKAQPDPEPPLVMKNHLVLDIRVEQFMLVINSLQRTLACSGFLQSKDDLPNLCGFSYITAFSGFELCICPTASPEMIFFFPISVTGRQGSALPHTCECNWAE